MSEKILVGCPYCLRSAWSDRHKLDRDRLVACESCRSLVSATTAERIGKEIELRLRTSTPIESISAYAGE
jgi:hypothetical protein